MNQDYLNNLEEWILKTGNGDIDAFRDLYDATKSCIYGYALSIMKNIQEAEDIMQDAFVKIKINASKYKAQGSPISWMITITRNLAYSRMRKKKFSLEFNLDDLSNDIRYSKIENPENKLLLESAFRLLDDRNRQIVILHAVSGLKHKEIAKILKLPISTVLSKYSRSIEKLKNYLLKGEVNYD